MKYNRICQILGIEKPVIQGPLSWLTDARLVAAVSNAGVFLASHASRFLVHALRIPVDLFL